MRSNILMILLLVGYSSKHCLAQSCAGKMVPLRPVGLSCAADLQSTCACSGNTYNCEWVWICPANAQPDRGFTIPLSGKPAEIKIDDPLEDQIQVQRIRQLQLQNQIQQEQLRKLRQAELPKAPPVTHANDEHSVLSGGLANGYFWAGLPNTAKLAWVSGVFEALKVWENPAPNSLPTSFPFRLNPESIMIAVDDFYRAYKNGEVPILMAIMWVDLKSNGSSKEDLDAFAVALQKNAADLK